MGLLGCKKMQTGVTPIPTPTRTPPEPDGPSSPTDTDVNGGLRVPGVSDPNETDILANPGGTPLGDREEEDNYWLDRDMFASEIVYFDFDSSTISPAEAPKLDTVASYLKSEPTTRLRVEGHCDERGTDEYNRALGSRRALSIREHLIALGVAADRTSTISYGEDKPAMFGSDETSWTKNRRGEFVLLIPKN